MALRTHELEAISPAPPTPREAEKGAGRGGLSRRSRTNSQLITYLESFTDILRESR